VFALLVTLQVGIWLGKDRNVIDGDVSPPIHSVHQTKPPTKTMAINMISEVDLPKSDALPNRYPDGWFEMAHRRPLAYSYPADHKKIPTVSCDHKEDHVFMYWTQGGFVNALVSLIEAMAWGTVLNRTVITYPIFYEGHNNPALVQKAVVSGVDYDKYFDMTKWNVGTCAMTLTEYLAKRKAKGLPEPIQITNNWAVIHSDGRYGGAGPGPREMLSKFGATFSVASDVQKHINEIDGPMTKERILQNLATESSTDKKVEDIMVVAQLFTEFAFSPEPWLLDQYWARIASSLKPHISGKVDAFIKDPKYGLGGEDYMAVHHRRTPNWHYFCTSNSFDLRHCYPSIERIVLILKEISAKTGVKKLFLSTNTNDFSEVEALQQHFEVRIFGSLGSQLKNTIEQMKINNDQANPFEAPDFDVNELLLVDQMVCARATYFVGNDFSSFSWIIVRLRSVLGKARESFAWW
jgi:hypothetical protein